MFNFLKRMKIKKLKKKLELLFNNRQTNPATDEELHKEIQLAFELGKMYDNLRFNKGFPHADLLALEAYRIAASLEDTKALYILAERMIERGKFWDELRAETHACKAHDKYAKDTYEEAFVYLKAAEDKGNFLAKRLHGLCYINGWGVDSSPDHGFKLVIKSIEQEGAWDRATEIFKELGLNKPEFFSYIMASKEN